MSIKRWVDKEDVVHTDSGMLAIKKSEFESALVKWMDLGPVKQWSMSERGKQLQYINTYVWNLEKWYWWICLQGEDGDTDVENGLVDTVGEGESGMNEGSSINIYTLSDIRWIAGEKLHRKSSLVLCDDLVGWAGGRGGRLQRKGMHA